MRRVLVLMLLSSCVGSSPPPDDPPDAGPICPAPQILPIPSATDEPPRPGHETEDWINVRTSDFSDFLRFRIGMIGCGCSAPPPVTVTEDSDLGVVWWLYGGADGYEASFLWARDANEECSP